jgi:cytidyltransferase-like protein
MTKTVFVSGCFDILHGGHIEFFNQAKQFGDRLVVSFASDDVLQVIKGKRSSLPEEHKKRLLESLSCVDAVVIGRTLDRVADGLDFYDEFMKIKPDYLVVTEDDKFSEPKQSLCNECGCKYITLPKTLNFDKISTTDIINWIKAPKEVPVRVDFAGGWLDVPRYAREDGYIVNCTISPTVSLSQWDYKIGGGLGGSGAYALLSGKDSIQSELDMGVGWQDPAVIKETGLCVWRSGPKPVLDMKVNPDFLTDRMAILWTGNDHNTPSLVNRDRDYNMIEEAGRIARYGVIERDFSKIVEATLMSYCVQREEGMKPLPYYGEYAKKYCGGGFGGYALYLFTNKVHGGLTKVQPFMRGVV